MNCPFCKSRRCVESGDRNYFCPDCKRTFDPTDDGDYSDRNPSARLERDERRQDRKKWPRRR